MSLWRRRQEYNDAIENSFITLAQIAALTFGVVLLWFFG